MGGLAPGRRDRGGRDRRRGGLAPALSLTTLAVEFVAQAVLLGAGPGLGRAPGVAAVKRVAAALALGAGLAGVSRWLSCSASWARPCAGRASRATSPSATTSTLSRCCRSWSPACSAPSPSPAESWWGGAFFTKGFPYFLSLYLGALALALAVAGVAGARRRTRMAAGRRGLLGLWYALGARGGLAPLLASLPVARWFRFPVKAVLLPHVVVCPCRARSGPAARRPGWGRFALAAAGDRRRLSRPCRPPPGRARPCAGPRVPGIARRSPPRRWGGGRGCRRGRLGVLAAGAGGLAASAGLAGGVCWPWWRWPTWHARGMGMNPQAPPGFFELLPEMTALRLDALDGGRVFSYGPDESPAFRTVPRRADARPRPLVVLRDPPDAGAVRQRPRPRRQPRGQGPDLVRAASAGAGAGGYRPGRWPGSCAGCATPP